MKKTVLITGARRGLGKELAKAFADAGYNLILACKSSVDLYQDSFPLYTGDLRDKKTIKYLSQIATINGIDILINNAAIYLSKPFEDITEDEIKEVLDINLVSPIMLTKAIWPVFKNQRHGTVVNINSMAGQSGANGESIYCASKFGLRGFSEALQYDATKNGIKVINVNIGAMQTDMTEGRKDQDRFIQPQEAAKAILNACTNYDSLRITDINILRSQY